jgi:hypothetical protein
MFQVQCKHEFFTCLEVCLIKLFILASGMFKVRAEVVIQGVSKTHDTILGACSMHKSNENIMCKHG